MQLLVIDRGLLVPQRLIEIIDDARLPSHNFAPGIGGYCRFEVSNFSIIAAVPPAESGRATYRMMIVESVTSCPATFGLGAGERFVHDAANGARATPALGAAAETMVDLPR